MPDAPTRRPLTITDIRHRAKDAIEIIGARRLRAAFKESGAIHLSQFLEAQDPSDSAERAQGLDAFTRIMLALDIKSGSDQYGAYKADEVKRFESDDARDLFGEWCRRAWSDATSLGISQKRTNVQYLSNDFALGTIQRPYDEDRTLRMDQVQPAIPLTEVISRTRTNQGPDYRARYLTEPTAADTRMLRVTELTELPSAHLTEGQRAIKLYKYGRKLVASYEALRNLPLDNFRVHIAKLALQTEVDQVAAAIDVMINGDGNGGTSAPVYALSALDANAGGVLTLKAWIAFRLKWTNPYAMTAILGRAANMTPLLTLNVGSANILATSTDLNSLRQNLSPMNTRLADGVRYGVTDDVPADRLLGFDGRLAVERVVEAGSEISEADRWITRQAEVLTFSMSEGYAIIDVNTCKVLHLDA